MSVCKLYKPKFFKLVGGVDISYGVCFFSHPARLARPLSINN